MISVDVTGANPDELRKQAKAAAVAFWGADDDLYDLGDIYATPLLRRGSGEVELWQATVTVRRMERERVPIPRAGGGVDYMEGPLR